MLMVFDKDLANIGARITIAMNQLNTQTNLNPEFTNHPLYLTDEEYFDDFQEEFRRLSVKPVFISLDEVSEQTMPIIYQSIKTWSDKDNGTLIQSKPDDAILEWSANENKESSVKLSFVNIKNSKIPMEKED